MKKKNGSKRNPTNKRKVIEKEAKTIVRQARKKPVRQRPPRTSASITGFGMSADFSHEWSVPVPAGIGNVTTTPIKRHSIRVRETELVQNITGNNTSTPVSSQFTINPGRALLFPWLSGIASNFELYRFHRLKFRYQPACGTTETGTVTMAIDYDVLDPDITTDQALMAIPGAKQGSTFVGFECDAIAGGKSKFAKDLFISTNTDDVTHDLGIFYANVTGTTTTSATTVGRLYVDYDCELVVTQIGGTGLGQGRIWQSTGGTPAVTNLLALQNSVSNSYPGFDVVASKLFVRNPGKYFYINYVTGTTFTTNASTGLRLVETGGTTITGVSAHNLLGTQSFLDYGSVTIDQQGGHYIVTNDGLTAVASIAINHLFMIPMQGGLTLVEPQTEEDKLKTLIAEMIRKDKRRSRELRSTEEET